MPAKALVLRHVHFEDLGTFGQVLEQAGYAITYSTVGDADFLDTDPLEPDLLVVLGGPIGVYEDDVYPFLAAEKAFIAGRLEAQKPILAICLGAQLVAAASGGRVFPSGVKEIGFKQITLTSAGMESPLRHLGNVAVLHWHGDTYDLPEGAVNLATSDLVEQQAYTIGRHVLAFQFHPEAQCDQRFERWLVGHAAELAAAKIDIAALRADAARFGPALKEAGRAVVRDWLSGLVS
jgi:GMP synthase (glutamine-hydrolysing)